MRNKLRPHLTYANVMSTIACCGVLAGGTAYAANTIGSADIIDESILSADIKNGEVKGTDIGIGQVQGSRITDGTLKTEDIADDRVTGADVSEATLAKVPDADKLDGLDSTGLLGWDAALPGEPRGRGSILANRIVRGNQTDEVALMEIPGLGRLRAQCLYNLATIYWQNTTAGPVDLWMPRLSGTLAAGEFVGTEGVVAPVNQLYFVADDLTAQDAKDGSTFTLGKGFAPGARSTATVHVSAFQSDPGQPCGFQAQATVWTG